MFGGASLLHSRGVPSRMLAHEQPQALEQETLVPGSAQGKQTITARIRALCTRAKLLIAVFVTALLVIGALLLASMRRNADEEADTEGLAGSAAVSGVDKLGAGLFLVCVQLLQVLVQLMSLALYMPSVRASPMQVL